MLGKNGCEQMSDPDASDDNVILTVRKDAKTGENSLAFEKFYDMDTNCFPQLYMLPFNFSLVECFSNNVGCDHLKNDLKLEFFLIAFLNNRVYFANVEYPPTSFGMNYIKKLGKVKTTDISKIHFKKKISRELMLLSNNTFKEEQNSTTKFTNKVPAKFHFVFNKQNILKKNF